MEAPSQQPSVGVIEPRDLVIARLFRGRPLPQNLAVYTLYSAELDLYRNTVFHYGDAEVPSITIGVARDLQLEIRPIARNNPTLGSSFYGICYILQLMLHPDYPTERFFESKWRVSNRVGDESLRNFPSNSSLSTPLLAWKLDALSPSSNDLGVPFPVPQTDLTLLVRARGAHLAQAEVLLSLNLLMRSAWKNVATNERSLPVNARTWNSQLSQSISVILRPRMEGEVPQMDDTDLAEAAFGLAYYSLSPPTYETVVAIVRPNEGGDQIEIGEIEIKHRQHGLRISGSGNGTLAGDETS
ncbi:MAG: hypothetical protein Q9207_004514 [Kuettlingeria erythrocarpa]